MNRPCQECDLLRYCVCDCLDDSTVTVAEMGGLFEGAPDSVEWLRDQRSR